jgi:CRP-like cAMP-binding protein
VNIWRSSGGTHLPLASLAVGESFGEMGLINGGKRSAGATAVEDTLALCISHERLHKSPRAALLLYRNLARGLADRLDSANDVIVFQSQSFGELPPLETRGR